MPSCMIVKRLLSDTGEVVAQYLRIVQGVFWLVESHFWVFAE